MNGLRLKQLVQAGYMWLKQHEASVNAYNVYPVPDGDTGTNMAHTMEAAWKAVSASEEAHAGRMAKAISTGALRGSRGNSGIILSQLWRGFAKATEPHEELTTRELIGGLREAATTAYGGVKQPVEGTMLTVARETAEAAEQAATENANITIREILQVACKAAHESVQRTPEKLKILKEAGVVDSGGYGYYLILDGMRRFIAGEPIDAPPAAALFARATTGNAATDIEAGYGYDVQYLIYAPPGQPLNLMKVRSDIEAMGECPLIMGDDQVIKVHVHVPDPGVPISYAARLGSLRDVVVEDMQAQSESFLPGQPPASPATPSVDVGIVAVASGEGLLKTFKSLGARFVIPGGQTMNPSVDDILSAIEQANARSVIVLPNNGNIVMTAQQAVLLSNIPARVVPTKTLPQGFAAMLAFNYEGDLEANVEALQAAAFNVTTGEITRSTRTVTINDVPVKDGQVIGLINDKLAVAGDDVVETTIATLHKCDAINKEVITIYYGNGLGEDEAAIMIDRIRPFFPNQSIDLIAGGQPHYYFVMGVE